MKFIKNLFNKKAKIVIEDTEEIINKNNILCKHCNVVIMQHEKRVTKGNNKLHIKCWRQLRNKAKQSKFKGM